MNALRRLLARIGRRPKGPAVIAHRGASRFAPENTLTAFDLAIDAGADAVELDLRVTSDEDLAVFHDARLGRTTSSGRPVSAMTADQVGRLDAGAWFNKEFRGEVVPFIDEALEALKGRAVPVIELKDAGELGVTGVRRLAESLDESGMNEDVLVVSGYPEVLAALRESSPGTPTACITARYSKAMAKICDYDGCLVWWKSFGPKLVDVARESGRFVAPWVVPTDRVTRFADAGVDAVLTDDPGAAIEALRRRS